MMIRLILAIGVLVGTALGLLWVAGVSPDPLQTLPEIERVVRAPEEPRWFLATQVALLAESQPESIAVAPDIVSNASPAADDPRPLPSPFSNGLLLANQDDLPKMEEPKNPDDRHLRKAASQFAYVEFKGVIGGRPIASFCVDPNSGACEAAGEGDTFREIQISKIDADSVLVTYRSATPIEKPLVPLDVEYKPMNQLSPEEVEVRRQRYQELYGNRFQEASLEHRQQNGGKVFNPPGSEEQEIAAEVYQETYGNFFRDLQKGKQNGNNREYPIEAPTLEESVAEYFDAYWPNQVDWEVTDEERNRGE